MMTGEGGMLVTNDEEIAKTAQMVRNHGEVILELKQRTYKSEFLGLGYRMTELEAAIGIAQLSKLDKLNDERIQLTNYLSAEINKIDGLHTKYDNVKHVYWMFGFSFNEEKTGLDRDIFCEALRAEGIPCAAGYVKPLYLDPLYLEKRAFAFKHYTGKMKYEKGICPVAESLHEKNLINTLIARPPAVMTDMQDIINAINKILENKNEL